MFLQLCPNIDFTKLFHALNQATHTEEGTLLLYTLLHRNEAFKSFVLAWAGVRATGRAAVFNATIGIFGLTRNWTSVRKYFRVNLSKQPV